MFHLLYFSRGEEQRLLIGFIRRRTPVRIRPPQPNMKAEVLQKAKDMIRHLAAAHRAINNRMQYLTSDPEALSPRDRDEIRSLLVISEPMAGGYCAWARW